MKRDHPPGLRSPGYTLVELLVVMGIIVLLAGLMLPAIGQATVAYHEFKTRSTISSLEVALASFYEQWGEYPPSSQATAPQDLDEDFESGTEFLAYFLMGPDGLGWRGESPFGGDAAGRNFGPYYESDQAGGGVYDAFNPSKPILYFRADPYRQHMFDVNDQGDLDSSGPPDEGFASQPHFELLAQIDDNSLPESQRWHRRDYLLIAPGADRLYGYVKQNQATDQWQAVTTRSGDAFCDDICNFEFRE